MATGLTMTDVLLIVNITVTLFGGLWFLHRLDIKITELKGELNEFKAGHPSEVYRILDPYDGRLDDLEKWQKEVNAKLKNTGIT